MTSRRAIERYPGISSYTQEKLPCYIGSDSRVPGGRGRPHPSLKHRTIRGIVDVGSWEHPWGYIQKHRRDHQTILRTGYVLRRSFPSYGIQNSILISRT